MSLEADGSLLDPQMAEDTEAWDEEERRAMAGDWEALGVDPPEMMPATINDLRATEEELH